MLANRQTEDGPLGRQAEAVQRSVVADLLFLHQLELLPVLRVQLGFRLWKKQGGVSVRNGLRQDGAGVRTVRLEDLVSSEGEDDAHDESEQLFIVRHDVCRLV